MSQKYIEKLKQLPAMTPDQKTWRKKQLQGYLERFGQQLFFSRKLNFNTSYALAKQTRVTEKEVSVIESASRSYRTATLLPYLKAIKVVLYIPDKEGEHLNEAHYKKASLLIENNILPLDTVEMGTFLRQRREEKGITPAHIIRPCGIRSEQISAIENGQNTNIETLLVYLSAIDCYIFTKYTG